jgi:tRNA(adenine34) deaminase
MDNEGMIQMIHEDWMRLALQIAAADIYEVPVGAIVVYNGEVIASAHNERENGVNPFAHAEILAMERAAAYLGTRTLKGCVLYVTLEPCPMCAGALLLAQPDACIFGAYDEAGGCCGSLYDLPEDACFTHRVPCSGGVLNNEAQALLSRFFNRLRTT